MRKVPPAGRRFSFLPLSKAEKVRYNVTESCNQQRRTATMLTIWIGRAGSGKSARVLETVARER